MEKVREGKGESKREREREREKVRIIQKGRERGILARKRERYVKKENKGVRC